MHVGIDCRLPTYQMGGISQYTIHLIQALGKIIHAEQFTIFQSRREKHSFLPQGANNFSRSNLWTPCHHPLERQALAIELSRHRLEVFHSPDFIPPATSLVRRIISVHDLTFLYYPEFLTTESRRYYSDQIKWAVSVASHIIADSEATRIDLINLLGVAPQKVTTIYLAANPIYAVDHSPDAVAQTVADYRTGRGFVLSVGTLEPRKNLPTLLRVYHRLRRDFGVLEPLVLVGGKGWIYDEIYKSITELGLTEHVRHLNGVPDVKLAHLYRAAGVLAFPSRYEGFGLPALEAMHGGCPVVVSNRGSLPEVVGNAGILLEPDNIDAWVDALGRVLRDDALAGHMKLAGLEQAHKFTWDKTAAMTLAVYRMGKADR